MQDYTYLELSMKRARSEAAGKPLENNTRLFRRTIEVNGETIEAFSVKYHNTFIVDRLPDGRAVLANGGWNTSTTIQRVRTYGSNYVFTEKGNWYVRLQPDEDDPRPSFMMREIPRPFTIHDPGPEPVKDDDGIRQGDKYLAMPCIAGTTSEQPWQDINRIFGWDWEKKPASNIHVSKRYYPDGSGPYMAAHVAGIERIFYGTSSSYYNDKLWGERTGRGYQSGPSHEGVEYKQCPHCRRFDAVHSAWNRIENGDWYSTGKGVDRHSFKTMSQMLHKYGTQEGWREAYLADLRAVKQRNKDIAAWEDRNRVPFYDGIVVDEKGYAYRPSKRQQRRLAAHEKRVEQMNKRIEKFLTLAIETLKNGMPMPSSGDCWYCCMVTSEADERTPMGDAFKDHGHLLSHFKDKYVVPSLLVNALRERGYQDTGICMFLHMNPDTGMMGGTPDDYDNVKRDLRSYLRKRLIPAAPAE